MHKSTRKILELIERNSGDGTIVREFNLKFIEIKADDLRFIKMTAK